MPLLKDERMQSVELQLPVAATLPAGYLCQDTKKVQSCSWMRLLNSHVYIDTISRSKTGINANPNKTAACKHVTWKIWSQSKEL